MVVGPSLPSKFWGAFEGQGVDSSGEGPCEKGLWEKAAWAEGLPHLLSSGTGSHGRG